MSQRYFCGLDFGTSNSVISICSADTGEAVRTEREPTLFFFPETKKSGGHTVYFGDEAVEQYLHHDMEGRFIQSIKSLLPDKDFHSTRIHGVTYRPIDLAAMIIKHFKAKLETVVGEDVTDIVIGRPVRFSDTPEKEKTAKTRLVGAAKIAGFKNVHFQLEPIGAAYAYEQQIQGEQIVLVGDLGGGTTDFTIMRVNPERSRSRERDNDILTTHGVNVGGDKFDSKVMWRKLIPYFGFGSQYEDWGRMRDMPVHFYHTICRWEMIPFLKTSQYRQDLKTIHNGSTNRPGIKRLMNLIDHNLGYALFKRIEAAKHKLTQENDSLISFNKEGIEITEEMSETDFADYISGDVDLIEKTLDETLKKAGLSDADINTVFLTGGSSQIRRIRQLFERRFGENRINRDIDLFTSVAKGLALYARNIFQD